jgi:hypothetical protein
VPQFVGIEKAATVPGRYRSRDFLAEALFRPGKVHLEVVRFLQELRMGIDRIG